MIPQSLPRIRLGEGSGVSSRAPMSCRSRSPVTAPEQRKPTTSVATSSAVKLCAKK